MYWYEDNPDPATLAPEVLEELALNFTAWDKWHIQARAQQIQEWLHTDPGYFSDLPLIIYVHCDAGVDRTGEWHIVNEMMFHNASYQDAFLADDEFCVKVRGRPMLPQFTYVPQWFCYHLFYTNTTIQNCTRPDLPTF
eukprot:GEZU01025995.1.p3 GENE.GEZU01025995.1~~GEZU01025995.1.p3  ORF type:complete len:138 (-),score=32.20 GEZU01025995.1:31-444(-)